jgi:hypothetical protein
MNPEPQHDATHREASAVALLAVLLMLVVSGVTVFAMVGMWPAIKAVPALSETVIDEE